MANLVRDFAGKDRVELLLAMGASRWEATREAVSRSVRVACMPIINQMNVVGIVSIPGMMTGQILSGSDPSQVSVFLSLKLKLQGRRLGGSKAFEFAKNGLLDKGSTDSSRLLEIFRMGLRHAKNHLIMTGKLYAGCKVPNDCDVHHCKHDCSGFSSHYHPGSILGGR